MATARFFRVVALRTYGADLALSGLRLQGASGRVDGGAVMTSSVSPIAGSVNNLLSESTPVCVFSADQIGASGFWVQWTLPAAVDATYVVPVSTAASDGFLAACVLQSSADGVTWDTVQTFDRIPWPGAFTAAALQPKPVVSSAVSVFASFDKTTEDFSAARRAPKNVWGQSWGSVTGMAAGSFGLWRAGGASIGYAGSDLIASGNWVLSGWVYITTFLNPSGGNNDGGGFFITLAESEAANRIVIQTSSNGTAYMNRYGTSTYPQLLSGLTTGVLTHIELGRSGSTVYGFVNGVLKGSTTDSGVMGNGVGVLSMGAWGTNGIGTLFSNFTFSVGTACHTANFTPPAHSKFDTSGVVAADVVARRKLGLVASQPPAQPGLLRCTSRPSFAASNDGEFGGNGRVYGTTKAKGSPNTPRKSRVRLLRERDGLLAREVWSDPVSGAFEFTGVDAGTRWVVLAQDASGAFWPAAASSFDVELLP